MKQIWLVLAMMISGAALEAQTTNIFPASGDVGIGLTNPANKLDVLGSVAIGGYAGNVAPTDGLMVSGSVGIGTTSPATTLDVEAYSAPPATSGITPTGILRLKGTGGEPGELDFGEYNAGNYALWIQADNSSGLGKGIPLTINPLGGNVGIGTASPNFGKLEVAADATGAGAWYQGQLQIIGATNANKTLSLNYDTTNNIGVIQASIAGTGNSNLSFEPNGGNVGIGTTNPGYKLDVAGQIHTSAGIVFPDGSIQSAAYAGCSGGDYAESVNVSGDHTKYAPGDVLVIASDEKGDVVKSTEAYSTTAVGIYSTKPGVLGRRQTSAKTPDEIPMAMLGIVPTKVSAENGPIRRGDLLVTSSTEGYAMKGTDRSRLTGAVIGKALGSLDSGTGVIEVVVTLQ